MVSAEVAAELRLPWAPSLAELQPSTVYVERVPIGFSRQHLLMGFGATEDDSLTLAVGRTESWQQVDVLRRYLRRRVKPVLSRDEEILRAINHAYQQRDGESASLVANLDNRVSIDVLGNREDLLDSAGQPTVIKLVNSILFEAVQARASDVHIQPYEDSLVARQRIDGVLFDALNIPKEYQEEIISRLKVLGKMNIAEKRLPQDGRATVQVGDRMVDLRIASLPTSYGERVVIRFLDKSARLYTLGELGMASETLIRFRRLIQLEHGLLLATGPTGGGKSTTLYAALQEINSQHLNVLTLEDPIEYQLQGISQTQINTRKGMTFAGGMRSVLRQDPDVIMVGEIRDQETAVMGIQAALTGHLVFSTLHTNDASSAVTRLLDLGIEPYLVASSVVAVIAQRLVRRICEECRYEDDVDGAELQRLGLSMQPRDLRAWRGKGCDECRGTGYRGRVGIYELLVVDDSVRRMIQSRSNAAEIREAAISAGMRLLRDDGIAKVREGKTTIEEIVRVTMRMSQ
jgi:general secretion pathway protein E